MSMKIIYTKTDEAPALATYSFLPMIQRVVEKAGIEVEIRDISLAGRIVSQFPEFVKEEQRMSDDLAYLGELVKTPEANVIKLPNISASLPQLKDAIKELQEKGFTIPDYPDNPGNSKEEDIKKRYDKVKGSAVNPVLREGNSDRRAPQAVKNYAKAHPHSMGEWTPQSKSHVASMTKGDFYGSEKSITFDRDGQFCIKLIANDGQELLLKDFSPLQKGEIIDSAVMSRRELQSYYLSEIKKAKDEGVLLSLHLKATMMKVSDPILFGHCVRAYFSELFEDKGDLLEKIEVNPNDGLSGLLNKIQQLDESEQKEIKALIDRAYTEGPDLAMVDSDRGITNLHMPNHVIIDASMPAAIRNSGKMWDREGKTQDTKALIPDRSYGVVYQAAIDFCKENGALNPASLGSVSNVGLMAQKAEEYGSHDKTFEIAMGGSVQVQDQDGNVLMEQSVEVGDIFRMCQVKDAPVRDWVSLAVRRSRQSGAPAVFWLDPKRAHDRELEKKVQLYLKDQDTAGLDISILSPQDATTHSMKLITQGKDVISVTGNVLRDYLTDLFPILEVGTSAKMLSIVPLMQGGGLFETGAGGSAPKHVEQLLKENHLRWDSLGEFLALAVSLEHLSIQKGNSKAGLLGRCLDNATEKYLENNRGPSRKVMELDNRGSHYFLFKYWVESLAAQNEDQNIKDDFSALEQALNQNESAILDSFTSCQGKAVDLGGYFMPDQKKALSVMRPSSILNNLLSLNR